MKATDHNYQLIQQRITAVVIASRSAAARRVNQLMSATYWEIGRHIVQTEQGGEARAEYGDALIERLAKDLTKQFGRGFSRPNLWRMRAFHLAWPEDRILSTVSRESDDVLKLSTVSRESTDLERLAQAFPLPWSAYVHLLTVKNERGRQFYENEALRNGWSVRQLERQINSQFYERAALARNKAAMLKGAESDSEDSTLAPLEAIKDPFVLEFLDLKDEYSESESEFEEALIEHLTDFLLELGDDLAFVGRQRRLRLDDQWFRVDLLFFHRGLKCLLIVDLKVGRFSYTDAGQMHMYLNYAREHWMKPGENPPVGLILAASKGTAEAHYALEGLSNQVLAAEYQTVLPQESVLAEELMRTQRALASAVRPSESDDVD